MIYIYTTKDDSSVNEVIKWLNFYNKEYKRINSCDFFNLFENNEIFYSNIVHWFWKWDYNYFSHQTNEKIKSFPNVYTELVDENTDLFELFFKNYVKNVINNPLKINIDKYTQIVYANKYSIKTPDSILTNNKKTLIKWRQEKEIITKNLNSSFCIKLDNIIYSTYTSCLNDFLINTLPDKFYPSFFQEKIESNYELRSIYIDGDFYSTALIKHKINQSIDIRKAISEGQVSSFPYELPVDLKIKLKEMMNSLDIQIASIDMLVNSNMEYVFLELNPSGQFLGYSQNNNFYIEKKIAEYLIKKSEEKKYEKRFY